MTVPDRTAVRPPNPDCEVCQGTGTDLVFEGTCTDCWRVDTTAAEIRQILADRWHAMYPPRTHQLTEVLDQRHRERRERTRLENRTLFEMVKDWWQSP